MGKTVQIDDDVMQAAEEIAAERGLSAGEVISDLAREALKTSSHAPEHAGPPGTIFKNGWYVLPHRGGPPVTVEMVQHLIEEADLEDAGLLRSE
jgi:hypothetical protein